MKRAIIIGASSGIGKEIAKLLLNQGWYLGVAARREDRLMELKQLAPSQVNVTTIDITQSNAAEQLNDLFEKMGSIDLVLLSSGIGYQNIDLQEEIELSTVETNVMGFVRITDATFHYFKKQGYGHLAVISSIAGTKGLGVAPAYSATKRFQNTYIDALEQLAHLQKIAIDFTDIRPGFVKTDLLNDGKHYPLLMSTDKVAKKIVKAIESKKRVAIIDWRYRLIVAGWRLIPRFLWKKLPIKTS